MVSDTEYADLMELCRGGRLYDLTTGEEVPTTLRERIVNMVASSAADGDILKHVREWGPVETVRRIAKRALDAEQVSHAREFLWVSLLYGPVRTSDRRLYAAHAALAEGRLDQARRLLDEPCWLPL